MTAKTGLYFSLCALERQLALPSFRVGLFAILHERVAYHMCRNHLAIFHDAVMERIDFYRNIRVVRDFSSFSSDKRDGEKVVFFRPLHGFYNVWRTAGNTHG